MVKERLTRQKEILENEIKNLEGFFVVEELLKKVKIKESKIGIATIYRFLKDKTKKGKIYSYACSRRTVYSKQKTHFHYECEKTGKIIHFELKNLDFLKKIRDKVPGTINSIQIEIKGICNSCKNI